MSLPNPVEMNSRKNQMKWLKARFYFTVSYNNFANILHLSSNVNNNKP